LDEEKRSLLIRPITGRDLLLLHLIEQRKLLPETNDYKRTRTITDMQEQERVGARRRLL